MMTRVSARSLSTTLVSALVAAVIAVGCSSGLPPEDGASVDAGAGIDAASAVDAAPTPCKRAGRSCARNADCCSNDCHDGHCH
jgi:hypothetical protein